MKVLSWIYENSFILERIKWNSSQTNMSLEQDIAIEGN